MVKADSYNLVPDRQGLIWDLLLYVPTVSFLFFLSLTFWYSGKQSIAYLAAFLGSFFLIAGANRIFKTRLMILPSAPVGVDINRKNIRLRLKNGKAVDLVKNVRFFSDFAGKSFGLSGMDLMGKQQQFVIHKGQFQDEKDFKTVQDNLRKFR